MSNCDKKISQLNYYPGTNVNNLIIPVVDKTIPENYIIDFNYFSGFSDVNIYITGSTLSGDTLILSRNDGAEIYQDLSPLLFTGNTSGTCINDLYVHNLNGCSPINILNNLIPKSGYTINLGSINQMYDNIYTNDIVLSPKQIPTSPLDPLGNVGQVIFDDYYLYIKTNNGWSRQVLNYQW